MAAPGDQMDVILFQYMDIYNNENVPNGKNNLQNWVQHFANTKRTLKNIEHDF